MTKFEKYIENLASHEDKKGKSLINARERILVNAGIRLNWIGDYIANPKIKYRKIDISVDKVLFTGTNPEWNKILIDRCQKNVTNFKELIKNDKKIRKKFASEASYGNEQILIRGPDENGFYSVFDGMHRFLGIILKNKKTVQAYVPINEQDHLPVCEAHVVYDLIRGFQRHANNKQGEKDLYHALKLLARTYENVIELLEKRFNFTYVADRKVQKIIKRVGQLSRNVE